MFRVKRAYLVALLLASVAFSGCAQLDPEGTAIAIADQLPEVKLMSRVVDSIQRVDQCTFDKFYSGLKKIYEAEGIPLPEITESQRAQAEAMIQQMGDLAKRCQIRLSKSAEKESENVYIVKYKLETAAIPECSALSGGGDAQVRVDLSTGKAEARDSGQDIEKYEEAFDELGECAAMSMMMFATGTVTQATETTQTTGTTQPTTQQGH